MSLITDPLVEIRMDFPSGENFRPVHSISLLSTENSEVRGSPLSKLSEENLPFNLNEEKGPLSKDLRS